MKPQEWESMDGNGIGKMDLSKLGYTGEDYDAVRKTLAPITYDDNGEIIPLSQRFNREIDDVRKSFVGGQKMSRYTDKEICKALKLAEKKLNKSYSVGTIKTVCNREFLKLTKSEWVGETEYVELEKAFGKKDLSKLHKKQITDKNGHNRTVWVKNEDLPKQKRSAKQEETNTSQNEIAEKVAIGNTISFKADNGSEIQGAEVKSKGLDGVIAEKNGVRYQVKNDNITEIKNEILSELMKSFFIKQNKEERGFRDGSDGLQPKDCDNMKIMWEKASEASEDFKERSKAIVDKFKDTISPMLFTRTKLKGTKRAKEKLQEDEIAEHEKGHFGTIYDEKTDTYHCRTLRDVDGHTFCVKKIEDVAKLMKYFEGQNDIIRIKNNFAEPSPVGYSDVNMNIRLPNGTIAEIQLNTMANMVAKENYGHALYEVFRTIKGNPKFSEKYKELNNLMAEAQKTLYGLSNEYSKKGNFPNGIQTPFGATHKPYEDAIKGFVKRAKPLFDEAVNDGVFPMKPDVETGKLEDNEAKLHFISLCSKLGLETIQKSLIVEQPRYYLLK